MYEAVFVHDPRGSGGTWHYTLLGTVTDTAATVVGLTPNHNYTFTVTAFDTSGNQSGFSSPYVAITTPSLPTFFSPTGRTSIAANHPINRQVPAYGNPSAMTYSVVSGPADLAIDPNTGRVNWTPTPDEVGTYPVTFRATNAAGSTDLNLTLT